MPTLPLMTNRTFLAYLRKLRSRHSPLPFPISAYHPTPPCRRSSGPSSASIVMHLALADDLLVLGHGAQVPFAPPLAAPPTPLPPPLPPSSTLLLPSESSAATPTAPFIFIPTPLVDASPPQGRPASHCPPHPLANQYPLSTVPSECSDLQMRRGRLPVAILSAFLSLFTVSEVYQHFGQNTSSEGLEEKEWIASSRSWMERKTCQWFGLCGVTHLNSSKWINKQHRKEGLHRVQEALEGAKDKMLDFSDFWTSGKARPEDWSADERRLREIPQYVLDHAPLVHLFSGEQFWPCDIADHLIHTTPHLNYTPLQASSDHPNLTNLDDLNQWGRFVYLQSDDNVEERPGWLGGENNVPTKPGGRDDDDDDDAEEVGWADWDGRIDGELPDDLADGRKPWYEAGIGDTKDKGGIRPNPTMPSQATPTDTTEGEEYIDEDDCAEDEADVSVHLRRRSLTWATGKRGTTPGGRSEAPAVLIVVDKGNGVVDAFWFYFYSYNLGNVVLNVRFGNHVGDWEHSVVRFHNGKPKAVFFSEHNFGEAYAYEAVEKIGKRPVGYIAIGTHAMYATPGTHAYILPWGLLHDVTDRGPLWDPLLNAHSYTYDYAADKLRASALTPQAPTNWFYYKGHWGDKFYPLSDPRQYRFAGQYHYVNGPLGPRHKNLGRKRICQGNGECRIKTFVDVPGGRARRWVGRGAGELEEEEGTETEGEV